MNDLDNVLDRVASVLDQLGGILDTLRTDAGLAPIDPKATVDTMTVGGWVKLPGRERWRKIASITRCHTSNDCHQVVFADKTDRDGDYVHLDPFTAYPFLTEEQFDTACDRERATT